MHQEIIVIIIIIKMAYSITRATNQIMLKRSIMVQLEFTNPINQTIHRILHPTKDQMLAIENLQMYQHQINPVIIKAVKAIKIHLHQCQFILITVYFTLINHQIILMVPQDQHQTYLYHLNQFIVIIKAIRIIHHHPMPVVTMIILQMQATIVVNFRKFQPHLCQVYFQTIQQAIELFNQIYLYIYYIFFLYSYLFKISICID